MLWLYEIDVDAATGVVEVAITGFWTVETVTEFGRLLQKAFNQVECAGKVPVVLSDSSRSPVQHADVVSAMTRLGHDLAPLPRKTAIVANGQLLHMQAKRVVTPTTAFRSFHRRDLAMAWLLAKD